MPRITRIDADPMSIRVIRGASFLPAPRSSVMKNIILLTLTAVLTTSALLACTEIPVDTIPPVGASGLIPTKRTMEAFKSEAELTRYLQQLAARQRREEKSAAKAEAFNAAGPMATAEPSKDGESVTNTQHAGVDEGGIVKVHGDHLLVLRRGRLFTVAIGDGALKPISAVDAAGCIAG